MKLPKSLEERLTERAGAVLEQAETAAKQNRDKEISKNHLTSALFQTRGSLAFNLLNIHRISLSDIPTPKGQKQLRPLRNKRNEPKISPELEEVLKNAMSQAAKFNYRYIGTEHLLWALLDELRLRMAPEKRTAVDNIETHLKELFTISTRINHQGTNLQQVVSPGLSGAGILDALLKSAYENLKKTPGWQTNTENVQNQFLKNMLDPGKGTNSSKNPDGTLPEIPHQFKGGLAFEEPQENQKSALSLYAVDLVKQAKRSKLDPVIGRDKELERLITVLCRRTKNNPMLIGEPGVGKTACVLGLAQKIARSEVPQSLAKKHIFQLDLGLIIAGTMFRGEFEARFKDILKEAEQKEAIIFIDEIHTIVGAGSAQGSLDAANILKPLLSQNEFQVIGATTIIEWRKHIEKDAALERRFQTITIEEPGIKETRDILEGLAPHFERHHKMRISSEAIEATLLLSRHYITNRFFPDKAIDVMDEACASKRALVGLKNKKIIEIDAADIARIVSLMTHIPVEKLKENETKKLLNLEKILSKIIIGQDEAIKIVASTLRRARAGFAQPSRPLGSFLFLGPTGVGKTELAKVLAREVFADKNALIKLDMSEFSEPHSVAKLIGSPPGYVGFEEGGLLTEKVRMNPYSVIIFDEIEKAHPQLANILLQILEDGILTDSHGRKINFRNAVIVLTSNIGTRDFAREAKCFGFVDGKKRTLQEKFSDIKETCLKELRNRLRPELIARIDSTIVFNPLGEKEIEKITEISFSNLKKRAAENGFDVSAQKPAIEFIAQKAFNAQSGARRVRQLMTQYIEDGLAGLAIKNPGKKKFLVVLKNGKIFIG